MNILPNFYLSIAVVALGLCSTPTYGNIETPAYVVVKQQEPFEIRQYQPMLIAEVIVNGKRKQAATSGFKLLADYIFGNNQRQTDMAMTAPVQQHKSGESWTISFVMPAAYSLQSIPSPIDDRVVIKQVQEKIFAVIQFAGWNSDRNVFKHEDRLREYLRQNNLKPLGNPTFAFYDPPFKLPMFRRNEVMLEIAN